MINKILKTYLKIYRLFNIKERRIKFCPTILYCSHLSMRNKGSKMQDDKLFRGDDNFHPLAFNAINIKFLMVFHCQSIYIYISQQNFSHKLRLIPSNSVEWMKLKRL